MNQMRSVEDAVRAVGATDPALRAYLQAVYLRMAGGLLLAAATAEVTTRLGSVRDLLIVARADALYPTLAGILVAASPAAIVILLVAGFRPSGAHWLLSALTGGALSVVTATSVGVSAAPALLITAAAVASLSAIGRLLGQTLPAVSHALATVIVGGAIIAATQAVLPAPGPPAQLSAAVLLVIAAVLGASNGRLKRLYFFEQDAGRRPSIDRGVLAAYLVPVVRITGGAR